MLKITRMIVLSILTSSAVVLIAQNDMLSDPKKSLDISLTEKLPSDIPTTLTLLWQRSVRIDIPVEDLSSFETFLLYCQVFSRLHTFGTLLYFQLPEDMGIVPAPDNLAQRSESYKSRMTNRMSVLTVENYPLWDKGNILRQYFLYSKYHYIVDLTNEEFNHYMTDPFCPNKQRFQYSCSPIASDISILLTSVGPDGVADLDISNFDQNEPDWGLGEMFVNKVYDPTNGILSAGDIVYPPVLNTCYKYNRKNSVLRPLQGFCE